MLRAASSRCAFEPIETDNTVERQFVNRHLTTPLPISKREPTQLSSKLLLNFLATITPLAGLLVVISLTTKNHPMALASSFIALTGFFAIRFLPEKFEHELEVRDRFVNHS